MNDHMAVAMTTEAIESRLGELEECYERRLRVHPELAGKVVIHANISMTGEVDERCITEDTVDDAEIRACVNALVQNTRFPIPYDGPVDVSFPFVFTPRSAAL